MHKTVLFQHKKGWGLPSVDPNCLTIHVKLKRIKKNHEVNKFNDRHIHILLI